MPPPIQTQPRFRNLLVPTDFSEGAARALRLAIEVARASKGCITLLHVGVAPGLDSIGLGPPESVLVTGMIHRHEERAREQRHAAEKLAREEVPGDVPWRVVLREGFTPTEILSEANGGGYDLVVMGTHGRGGLERVLLGSVTERVLRAATSPVLVTR